MRDGGGAAAGWACGGGSGARSCAGAGSADAVGAGPDDAGAAEAGETGDAGEAVSTGAMGVAVRVTAGGMPGGPAAFEGEPAQAPSAEPSSAKMPAALPRIRCTAALPIAPMLIFSLPVRVQEGAAAAVEDLVSPLVSRWRFAVFLAAATAAAATACRSPSAAPAPDAVLPADVRDGDHVHVQLSWRLFETQRWIEGGEHKESAVVQLLVNGGAPAQVDLGRRDTAGCTIGRPAADDFAGAITTLECGSAGAQVLRSGPGELRIEASDRAPHGDATHLHEAAVAVHIPADADVSVDRVLQRVPDE